MTTGKKKRTEKEKHKTSVEGSGEAQRKKVKTETPTEDPPKPASISYTTLDKDPKYGSEFVYSWTVGGCFNTACTQKHAKITTKNWSSTYITSLGVSAVPKVSGARLHKRIVPQFKAFFAAVAKKGLADKVTSFAGGFVARTITNNPGKLSNHALGTAVDINAPENGYGTKGAARGEAGSVRELADFCADFGLYWGGWYTKNKDLMHFEAVKVLEGAALRAACEKHGVVYEEIVQVQGDFPIPPSGGTMLA